MSIVRLKTEIVNIGHISIGGNLPICIQTMTNTDTNNIEATIDQIKRIYNKGCDLIRIAVPTSKEVLSLKKISEELKKQNIKVALIADVHFNPTIAEEVAPYVAKVRINPGNYVNRSKSFQKKEYSLAEIQKEKEQIYQRLLPLLNICKTYGTAIRIGINFASLSWRMIHMYGNTPQAMVASALEFLEICRNENFNNLVFSFKASDVNQTINANRLYVNEILAKYGKIYPLHLGITEAGLDIEGRIKSIIGIGTLLYEGIGDTIRVSLTESPENEIPIAEKILKIIKYHKENEKINKLIDNRQQINLNVTGFNNRFLFFIKNKNVSLPNEWENILNSKNYSIIKSTEEEKLDNIIDKISKNNSKPIILHITINDNSEYEQITFILGYLLVNKLIDGLFANIKSEKYEYWENVIKTTLQCTNTIRLKNEYVSCPSCARTQYDIEKYTRKVKEATNKFSGYKIAVMGCIVNGPGEMSDADYGLVGSGNNLVNIYKKGKIIYSKVNPDEAVDLLVKLIEADENYNSNSR